MARIVFFGSPEFAVPSLESLVKAGEEVSAVVTQPDRPAGRGRKTRPPAVKTWASANGIQVLQPENVNKEYFLDAMRSMDPDLGVVVAFGQILSKRLLEIPRLGFINVHASLLPKYRGAAPIQWAVLNGEEVTGVTIQKVVRELDAGDILVQEELEIGRNETAGELHDRLAVLGARMLPRAVEGLESGTLVPVPQEHEKATYARMLKKSDGKMDWSRSAEEIHNLVRGLNPWPSAFTFLAGKRLIVHRTEVMADSGSEKAPGVVVQAGPDRLLVAAGKGLISLAEVQLEGRKRTDCRSFLAGFRVEAGWVLG